MKTTVAPVPRHRPAAAFVTLGCVFVAFVLWQFFKTLPAPSASSSTVAAQSADDAKRQEGIKASREMVELMLKKGGVTKIDQGKAKAWVDSYFWHASDAELKERMTRALAVYCNADFPSVDVFDAHSAKKIASFSPLDGFKVY